MERQHNHNVEITTRERLVMAWVNSMNMVKDFQAWAEEIENDEIRKVFKNFAEEEAEHSSRLRDLLLKTK